MLNESYDRVKWQIDCDEQIKKYDNVILSSPTGTGKTDRYERWALSKPERPIFITSPIKALSNQRYRELLSKGYKVGLETGDVHIFPESGCDIICCTQEIYNNKYRDYENSTLIVDEFSYIFGENERARAYVDSIHYSKSKNIIICSATFNDTKKIKQYIERLTRRKFFVYENKERLTTLEYKGKISMGDIRDSLVVSYFQKRCVEIAKRIYKNRLKKLSELLSSRALKNVNINQKNKNAIMMLAKKYDINNELLLELATMGVVYYYGKMYPKEKLFVEQLFEMKIVDTIVGTDALALGVNFPIKNVVFTQLSKKSDDGIERISKSSFEQLSGRAGRKGYFDNGYVYYCDDFNFWFDTPELVENNRKYFNELINSKEDDFSISLTPDIKEILTGKKSIEEEIYFIKEFSTMHKSYKDEEKKIIDIINYIKNFDMSIYYLRKIFTNLTFEEGYATTVEGLSEKTRRKIDRLSTEMTFLQTEFDENIASAYLREYSPEVNCTIFADILTNMPIEELVRKYCREFFDYLLLRKYIYCLSEKYFKKIDVEYLERIIDSYDFTALHPEVIKFEKRPQVPQDNNVKVKKNNKKHTIIKKRRLDRIKINGIEYIKLSQENDGILVCKNTNEKKLMVEKIPLQTIYNFVGYLDSNLVLFLLNRLDYTLVNDSETEKIKQLVKEFS